ncbi:MAG: hypothetical protein R3358_13940 [Woeseiaceae bacterium]|nr:hypothetical protein [Woeseiaceae bacterium]
MQADSLDIRHYRRPGAFAWVALCALAMLQLAAATHDSQHSLGDITDACATCVQLDSGGNALHAVVDTPAAPSLTADVTPLLSRISDRRPATSLRTRAPPRG